MSHHVSNEWHQRYQIMTMKRILYYMYQTNNTCCPKLPPLDRDLLRGRGLPTPNAPPTPPTTFTTPTTLTPVPALAAGSWPLDSRSPSLLLDGAILSGCRGRGRGVFCDRARKASLLALTRHSVSSTARNKTERRIESKEGIR